jgi:hypothetical protein
MSHYPSHLREAFCEWLDADCPAARVEVNYEPQIWPADRFLRRMLNCSDVMPGWFYEDVVERYELTSSRKPSYGAIARLLLERANASASHK